MKSRKPARLQNGVLRLNFIVKCFNFTKILLKERYQTMGNLQGKYAIVTGGGKGIGAAVVKRFIQEQVAGVAIFEWDYELAKKTAAEIGGNILPIKCDVSDEEQVKAAVETTLKEFGRIDILVNNAGITRDSIFHKMTTDQWNKVLGVNLNGTYYCCKYVMPHMRNQNYGKIVNLSSTSAKGNAGQANYSASKGAIEGLTKTLAREGARKNITVNALAPAMIDTEMQRAIPEEILEDAISRSPSLRLGTVDELAGAVFFYSSDDSSYVNGTVLPVCGGYFT